MSDLVLVTGISGFLGGHVALELLKAGYSVRGSVRNLDKSAKVRETLAKHGGAVERLDFVALDLLKDEGWAEAMEGVRFVHHVASPFVTSMPDDKMELIRPAVEGTERALSAAFAAKVERVVLTSSAAAIMYGHDRARTAPYTSADWTVLGSPDVSAYTESKTLAEQRAWEMADAAGRRGDLAVINPVAILGPLLDEDPGTSAALVLRLLGGTVPAAPRISFPIVDVRDVAKAHRAAMEAKSAGGQRFPLSAETMSIMELGRVLGAALPEFSGKMPKFIAPNWVVRLVAMVDADIRGNLGELGLAREVDPSEGATLLGRDLISGKEAAIATAHSLVAEGLVKS